MNLIERVQGRQAGAGSLRLLRAKSVYPFPALCSAGSPGNLKTIPVEILAWPKAHSDLSVAAYGKTQANFSASPIFAPGKWANTTNQSLGVGGISFCPHPGDGLPECPWMFGWRWNWE